jgi:hypothetical protein
LFIKATIRGTHVRKRDLIDADDAQEEVDELVAQEVLVVDHVLVLQNEIVVNT